MAEMTRPEIAAAEKKVKQAPQFGMPITEPELADYKKKYRNQKSEEKKHTTVGLDDVLQGLQ